MKLQDILLLLPLLFFIYKNKKDWTTLGGIVLLIISIPLFAKHVFFTAEHLVYFAALYFLLAAIQTTIQLVKSSK